MTKSQASSDLKMKAVKYYYKINNYSEVCRVFECSERSLKRWIYRYEKYKNVDERKELNKIIKNNGNCLVFFIIFIFPNSNNIIIINFK